MRHLKLLFIALAILSCNSQKGENNRIQQELDSMKVKLRNPYKPGLGEFMNNVQLHHAKVWFAAENNNWKLAEYEMHEMQEALQDVQKYETDRPESDLVDTIYPALDSMNNAIKSQNQASFKSSYTLLTNSCNNCHKATGFDFNTITIPTNSPVVNQNFAPIKK